MNRCAVFLLVMLFLVVLLTSPVHAQEPTPEPTTTPTPAYIQEIEIEPGVTFILERRISYGDIAVVLVVSAVLMVVFILGLIRILRLWLR